MAIATLWKNFPRVFPQNDEAQFRAGLIYSIPSTLGVLSVRYALIQCCFIPIGTRHGIARAARSKVPENPVLENFYQRKNQWTPTDIEGLSKQVDMSERQIQKWLFNRKKERYSPMAKFYQSCWRCTYYTCMFSYGLCVLWDKPWLWDINQCWTSPTIPGDIWWYYVISLSFYFSLLISQILIDVKRTDYRQMLVHHSITILLMTISWRTGTCRIGSLILVLHDCADILIDAAKVAKYLKYHVTCNILFGLFAAVWLVTRLGIYPFWIIRHIWSEGWKHLPEGAFNFVFGLLLTLLMLHCFWTYLIVKAVVKAVGKGELEKDERSSSEEDE